jgi:hypothetical protein
MIFKCVGCDKTIVYENHMIGCYNIGMAMEETGWFYGKCSYAQEEVWLCENCATKAKELINKLLEIVKTPFYDFNRLIPFEIRANFKGEEK